MPTNSDYGHRFSAGHFEEQTRPLSPTSVGVQACPSGAIALTGASVARIVRENGVNANQMFNWRGLYQQGRLSVQALIRDDGVLPMVLVPSAPAPDTADAGGDAGGTIVLELGEVRARI